MNGTALYIYIYILYLSTPNMHVHYKYTYHHITIYIYAWYLFVCSHHPKLTVAVCLCNFYVMTGDLSPIHRRDEFFALQALVELLFTQQGVEKAWKRDQLCAFFFVEWWIYLYNQKHIPQIYIVCTLNMCDKCSSSPDEHVFYFPTSFLIEYDRVTCWVPLEVIFGDISCLSCCPTWLAFSKPWF